MKKILIVGGVAGGASFAARMRRLDEKAKIIMLEKDEFISFANCGLPYYVGGTINDKEKLTLQTPESCKKRFNVDVRIFNEAVSINRNEKKVKIFDKKKNEYYFENYDKLILSPGAKPIEPDITGKENKKVFSIRNIPDTLEVKEFIENNMPKKAIVVGGGYIGVEMAENLYANGLEITIIEFANHLITSLDYEIACDIHNHIKQKGINLVFNDAVKEIKDENNQLKVITEKEEEFFADLVILAVGVEPDTKLAKECKLITSKKGAIIVNKRMQTSDDNIFAVGDCVEIIDFVSKEKEYIPLAGPANKQGRIVADNIFGLESEYEGTQGTSIIKCFDLTVATTGLNETKLKTLNISYEKSYTYSLSHASYYPNAFNMSIKLIFEKESGRILGSQIIGYEGVDKRIDVFATAIRNKLNIYDLTKLELAYAPPYSSAKDPVNMAGYVAENILTKKVKVFHWDEVDTLPKDDSVLLIDVRTKEEYENGTINGFVNIPVDELRERISELDKNKKIYITCQIGLRGYIACRILTNLGFECANLSGGYRLYKSIFDTNFTIKKEYKMNTETMQPMNVNIIKIDACGLQCPGPVMKLSKAIKDAKDGEIIEISTTDPAFSSDVEAWCNRTGNTFGGIKSEKGITKAEIIKGGNKICEIPSSGNSKNIIVFSGDLDKAIASFIIANAAAAMGRKVSMFFTFWGLNILRKTEKVNIKKDFISGMFGKMMPRGTKRLTISKMNMCGIGSKMIRKVMKNKNVDSLDVMISKALQNGVELVACSMSMDIMGIKKEELIDGITIGGATKMLAHAEDSDMSLFV